MPIANELKQQLLPSLTGRPETSERDMMGTMSYLVRGRIFAFWAPDGIVVRTPRDAHDDLIASLKSSPFRGPQGGAGDWMHVPVTAENIEAVQAAIDHAYRYVAGAAKPPKRKKKR